MASRWSSNRRRWFLGSVRGELRFAQSVRIGDRDAARQIGFRFVDVVADALDQPVPTDLAGEWAEFVSPDCVAMDSSRRAEWIGWCERWCRFTAVVSPADGTQEDGSESLDPDATWKLLRRFFDFLEPNAEHYWDPPTYERLHGSKNAKSNGANDPNDDELEDGSNEDDNDGLYQAAYEDVVFQDSTADGVDGSVFESQAATSEEMERQATRVLERLAFHNGLARFWTTVSVAVGNAIAFKPDVDGAADEGEGATAVFSDETVNGLASAFEEWYRRSVSNREKLFALLDEVGAESIPKPAGHHDSMVDYDRQRMVRDSLIDNVVSTIVRVSQAERFLLSTLMISSDDWDIEAENPEDDGLDPVASELKQVAELFASAIERDHETATERCDSLLEALTHREMLYVPLAKSGAPRRIANVRIRHRIIEDLLIALPRLGMVSHTARLIETVRVMEQNVPAGRGAVTQFDELFEVGLRELVVCLVCATEAASGKDLAAMTEDADDEQPDVDEHLIECLEQLTEIVLRSWLDHSRTLRLSVLERVRHPDSWDELVEFIQQYGSDVFTQGFMKRANIRAILHCGVDSWLTQLEESGIEPPFELMHQLGDALPRDEAVKHLTLSLESVIENYNAYLDYNSTTTQSDRGEKLFMLLDFLRLKSNYDRVAWNLRPVVISHDVLVRRTRNAAAQLWRRALTDRVGSEAERYMKGLGELQSKYAMRMASVADRIGERFQRPMTIDRMRALVQPAIQQLHDQQEPHAFQILEDETRLLMREPTGAGMDVPQWLMALEDEVESLQPWSANERMQIEDDLWMQPTPLDLEELHRQLDELR